MNGSCGVCLIVKLSSTACASVPKSNQVFRQRCLLIFSNIGFRLVFDRETGKPKGYGFCEYKDQETALSAMRNLNGYELNGRALRVDSAASEKNREEMKGECTYLTTVNLK